MDSGFSSNYIDQMADRLNAEYYEKKYFGSSVLENIRTGNYNNQPTVIPDQKDSFALNTEQSQSQEANEKGETKGFLKRNWKNILCGTAIAASVIALIAKGKAKFSDIGKVIKTSGKKTGGFINKIKNIPSKIVNFFKKKPTITKTTVVDNEAVRRTKLALPSPSDVKQQISSVSRILRLPSGKTPLALPPGTQNEASRVVDNLGKTFTLAKGQGTVVFPTLQQEAAKKAANETVKKLFENKQLLLEAPKQSVEEVNKTTIGQKVSKLAKDVFNVFFGVFKKK